MVHPPHQCLLWHCFWNQPPVMCGGEEMLPVLAREGQRNLCCSFHGAGLWLRGFGCGRTQGRDESWDSPGHTSSAVREDLPLFGAQVLSCGQWRAVTDRPLPWQGVRVGFPEPGNDLALREAVQYMPSCRESENNGLKVGGFDKHFS